MTVATRK